MRGGGNAEGMTSCQEDCPSDRSWPDSTENKVTYVPIRSLSFHSCPKYSVCVSSLTQELIIWCLSSYQVIKKLRSLLSLFDLHTYASAQSELFRICGPQMLVKDDLYCIAERKLSLSAIPLIH